MATFVTGATGFIGGRLCQELASRRENVVALCRSKPQGNDLDHPLIKIAIGDIAGSGAQKGGLFDAMNGCERCVHLAGLATQWSRRSADFYTVNTEGTRNVLDAAAAHAIEKFVFVSTAGVYGPSHSGNTIVENTSIPDQLGTHYERSKRMAEEMVVEDVQRIGLNACIVCPTRVFGPGKMTEANSITRIMAQYESGQWWLMPGDGSAVGNYVHVDDVVTGLIKALEKGQSGQRYILGGENLSFRDLFGLFAKHSTNPRELTQVPFWAAKLYAYFQMAVAATLGARPKLTPSFVNKYFSSYRFNCEETKRKLGFRPRKVAVAVEETMDWLREQERAKTAS